MDLRRAVTVLGLAGAVCAANPRSCLAREPAPERRDVAVGLPSSFEPSGAAWHTGRNAVLVAGDEGQLALLDPAGRAPAIWHVGGDLEGAAVCDPDSPLVYLLREFPPELIEFDLDAGRVTRRRSLAADVAGVPRDRGPEALTCVPGEQRAMLLYIGVQHDGRILVYERVDGEDLARLVRAIDPIDGRRDLSALEYDRAGTIYAVYDTDDRLLALDRAGRKLGEWPLPPGQTEGLAIAPAGWFLADDGGPVWRYASRP